MCCSPRWQAVSCTEPRRRVGRPARVPGTPSRQRVELRFTDDELAVVRQFAAEQGLAVADAIRIGVLDFIGERTEGALPGVVIFRNRLRSP